LRGFLVAPIRCDGHHFSSRHYPVIIQK